MRESSAGQTRPLPNLPRPEYSWVGKNQGKQTEIPIYLGAGGFWGRDSRCSEGLVKVVRVRLSYVQLVSKQSQLRLQIRLVNL